MNGLLTRMLGAACLNPHTYEEIETDSRATSQAMVVVVLVSISAGIGGFFTYGIGGIIIGPLVGVIHWAVWAFITYLVGTTILKTPDTHADWGQLARTTGFAQTPGLLKIFGFLPMYIGSTILFIASAWQIICMIIAVKQALDYQNHYFHITRINLYIYRSAEFKQGFTIMLPAMIRALAVVVISFIISMAPLILLNMFINSAASGM